MIRLQYEDHEIHFEINLEEDLPMILGNSFKIEQVLINLLSNSRDALEAKTNNHNVNFQQTITIKTWKKGKYIILEFTDNGIGMSSKELESIFDPFYTTKGPEMGTGLGLSICYGILDEMNAEISVNSIPDEFTTFTIKFKTY
jgi:two-component system, NtrC family, sensor kinase